MENKGSVEMEEWVKERIEENKELFTTEELVIIQENLELCKKLYIMAIVNLNDTYKKRIE